jgi:hypothetical protein
MFNVIDVGYDDGREANARVGRRDIVEDAFMEPEEYKDEAKAFGTKMIKIDNKMAQKICAFAIASKFVNEQKVVLAKEIDTARILNTDNSK